MNNDIDTLMVSVRSWIAAGESQERVILKLKENQCSILGAIKIIRRAYAVDLGQAKSVVESHPAWIVESKAAASLHDDLEKLLRDSES